MLHDDLKKYVYDNGQASAKWEEASYVRGLINVMLGAEATGRSHRMVRER
jgi:hypothetical protein